MYTSYTKIISGALNPELSHHTERDRAKIYTFPEIRFLKSSLPKGALIFAVGKAHALSFFRAFFLLFTSAKCVHFEFCTIEYSASIGKIE